METRRIKVTVIDEMLGTNPGDVKVYSNFIASKAPDAKTMEEDLQTMSVQEMEDNHMTIFIKDENGNPMMPAYHMLGFFKSACSFLKKVDGTKSSKCKAYKKFIDGLVKVYPDVNDLSGRYIPLKLPEGGKIGNCQRPLRAQTMQGERVALANSDTVPAGTSFECDIVLLDDKQWDMIEEWLNYGQFNGLGQWRNSGKGAFTWEYVKEEK